MSEVSSDATRLFMWGTSLTDLAIASLTGGHVITAAARCVCFANMVHVR